MDFTTNLIPRSSRKPLGRAAKILEQTGLWKNAVWKKYNYMTKTREKAWITKHEMKKRICLMQNDFISILRIFLKMSNYRLDYDIFVFQTALQNLHWNRRERQRIAICADIYDYLEQTIGSTVKTQREGWMSRFSTDRQIVPRHLWSNLPRPYFQSNHFAFSALTERRRYSAILIKDELNISKLFPKPQIAGGFF